SSKNHTGERGGDNLIHEKPYVNRVSDRGCGGRSVRNVKILDMPERDAGLRRPSRLAFTRWESRSRSGRVVVLVGQRYDARMAAAWGFFEEGLEIVPTRIRRNRRCATCSQIPLP
ncbi:MAG: hypothetical protein KJO38_06900, partial [Gammaproteobacteria bacterium]|nr:hypothetical protein [Gammaproteobacteria bacterium]